MKKHKKPGEHKSKKWQSLVPKVKACDPFLATGKTALKAACIDCGALTDIEPRELNRSARPKCMACGSPCLQIKRVPVTLR